MPNHSLRAARVQMRNDPLKSYRRAHYIAGKPVLSWHGWLTFRLKPGPGLTSIPALEKALMLQDRHA
ncbi:MAG: hypothetical protein VYA67_22145 [Actinomycetota bacterium]|nr:hypothetical protein [Actinomycetota bacterium]